MIKVLFHGYKKYATKCDNCRCEFEYELEDVQNGVVICPDCNNNCVHNATRNVLYSSQIAKEGKDEHSR